MAGSATRAENQGQAQQGEAREPRRPATAEPGQEADERRGAGRRLARLLGRHHAQAAAQLLPPADLLQTVGTLEEVLLEERLLLGRQPADQVAVEDLLLVDPGMVHHGFLSPTLVPDWACSSQSRRKRCRARWRTR